MDAMKYPGRIKEVLVVEDSATDSKMMLRALAKGPTPKHVASSADGDQAMDYLRALPGGRLPDLMLLDLNLPKMDGWEVLAECKADPELRRIPIVVFTTSQLGSEVKRCYELGANSFVAKPFELNEFMDAMGAIEKYWLAVSA
jgi:chemotaxis family two-component system response regulator Rcp1